MMQKCYAKKIPSDPCNCHCFSTNGSLGRMFEYEIIFAILFIDTSGAEIITINITVIIYLLSLLINVCSDSPPHDG